MRRYLIVGNQTLTSDQLAGKGQDILAAGPAKLHLVVPATPTHEHLTWTEGAAHEVAERNLEAAVALLSARRMACGSGRNLGNVDNSRERPKR